MIKVSKSKHTQNLSDFIPWAILVAPGVIMSKDAVFQSTFMVRGYHFFSSESNKIETIISATNNMFMYCNAGWSVFVEATRVKIDKYPSTHWSNAIAQRVEQERINYYLNMSPLFEMKYYITICYKVPEKEKKVRQFFSSSDNSLDLDLEEFTKKRNDFYGLLKDCFLEIKQLNDDEVLSYLHSCVSSNRQTVLAPPTTMYIDAYVTDESLSVEETLKLGDRLLGVVSVHDFPHATRPDLLEELQMLPIEYRWQTRMIFLDEQQAINDIKKYRRKHYAQRKGVLKLIQEKKTGEEGLENTEAIMRALDSEEALELAGKKMVRFGYLTSVVVVSDTNKQGLQQKINMVKEVFQKKGFIVKEEQLNAMEAWLSSLPGQVYSNVRRALVHSVNLAHLLPLSASWSGESINKHLQQVCGNGHPHIIANSNSNVFYLNLNIGDVGHTFIVGPTGAGKSTILGMLCIQFLRYANAQIIIFDKDYSSLTLTKQVQGIYYMPSIDNKSITFQPYRDIDSSLERLWALQFTTQILDLHNVASGGEVVKEIKKSLDLLSGFPQNERTITALSNIIQHKSIIEVLSKYCGTDGLGVLFDGVEEHRLSNDWILFEMSYLMGLGKDAVIPSLSYLFHKVEKKFNGNPTLLVLDEGWLFLQHPVFAEQFKVWLKTLRKKNVYVIMATQELADAVKSPLLETIISACQTRIFLPDKSATQVYMKDLYLNFGLNERELSIIARAQAKKEYYMSTSKGSALFCLDIGKETLDILTKKER